jgi:hypothetical protein
MKMEKIVRQVECQLRSIVKRSTRSFDIVVGQLGSILLGAFRQEDVKAD